MNTASVYYGAYDCGDCDGYNTGATRRHHGSSSYRDDVMMCSDYAYRRNGYYNKYVEYRHTNGRSNNIMV